jgi:hypothetical protein
MSVMFALRLLARTLLAAVRRALGRPGAPVLIESLIPKPNPFWHYNTRIDAQQIVKSHAARERTAVDGHIVNYLGVAMPVSIMPHLAPQAGTLEDAPLPNNYHADLAEWAAALRAVDLARGAFTMIELGCGWGCWMNNTGIAAKRRGLNTHVIGIEGDPAYLAIARQTLARTGIAADEYTLLHGVASAKPGFALFPTRDAGHATWGLEPRFDVGDAESAAAVANGGYQRLPNITLSEAIGARAKIDLLHIDIQGGEADLVEAALTLLCERVGYLVIGTHMREIEGRLFALLQAANWQLEIERPATFDLLSGKPVILVDGVQGWKNLRFHAR